jgi:hypothetical protein
MTAATIPTTGIIIMSIADHLPINKIYDSEPAVNKRERLDYYYMLFERKLQEDL